MLKRKKKFDYLSVFVVNLCYEQCLNCSEVCINSGEATRLSSMTHSKEEAVTVWLKMIGYFGISSLLLK